MNPTRLLILASGIALLVVPLVTMAGNLDNAASPATGSSMPTTAEIYNRLDTGAAITPSAVFREPGDGPTAGTGKSLADIKAKLPVVDDANGAVAADVLVDKKFWGLKSGSWGLQTGTMPNNGSADFTPTASVVLVPAGYYSGGQVNTDAALITGNIRGTATIFGVAGKTEVVDTTEATAPAAAANISIGKKAFVNGALVTGTLSGGGYPCTTGLLSPLGRWCDNSNGTVRDMSTGLIWLQDAAWGGQYAFWATPSSATNAFDRAGQLKNGNPATLTDGSIEGDWGLPTLTQLKSLITGIETITSSAMYKFTGVQSNWYWSSSTDVGSSLNAWFVYLNGGLVNYGSKVNRHYVWPVRAGQ